MDITYSSANRNAETALEGEQKGCYVGSPASPLDVMREQMEYLFAHASPNCLPGCPDCIRLANVRRFLLRPFLQ